MCNRTAASTGDTKNPIETNGRAWFLFILSGNAYQRLNVFFCAVRILIGASKAGSGKSECWTLK